MSLCSIRNYAKGCNISFIQGPMHMSATFGLNSGVNSGTNKTWRN